MRHAAPVTPGGPTAKRVGRGHAACIFVAWPATRPVLTSAREPR